MSSTGKHCCYCKRALQAPTSKSRTALTYDHVVPKHMGGRKKVPCCRQCNQLKGPLHPTYWRQITERYPQWWTRFRDHGDLLAQLRADAWAASRRRQQMGKWPRDVMVPPPNLCRGLPREARAE